MRRAALLLALAAALAASVTYVHETRAGSHHDARVRSYFVLGRQGCRDLLRGLGPTDIGNITLWTGMTQVEAIPSPSLAPKYRRAFVAGCDAATG